MHLFDILEKREIVPHEEVERINVLLNYSAIEYDFSTISLKNVLDLCFRKTKISTTFLHIDELLEYLDLVKSTSKWTLKELFLYFETILTIIFQSSNSFSSLNGYSSTGKNTQIEIIEDISKNINLILEKCGYLKKIKDDFVYIVEKNKSTTEAIECIEDEDIAFELLEYNRYLLKGNIKEKAKILSSLAKYIEPIRESKILSKNNYNNLESDIGFYLNKFHIRHNNLDVKKPSEFLKKMTDEELESWYDIIYNTIIAIIITKAQIENHKKLEELKKENNL